MKPKTIKKEPLPLSSGRIHKEKDLPDDLVRFSFRHLQINGKFGLPPAGEKPEYLSNLLDRLKSVSDFTVDRFRTEKSKALRAHKHNWTETTEPNGYSHLSPQLQDCEPWQFCLTANEHGRVHGILIDNVFYVIWLDHDHALYPEPRK